LSICANLSRVSASTNSGTTSAIIVPVAPTYGERFLDEQKEHLFRRESCGQLELDTMIGRAELLQTLVDVITYLPIVEKFAFAKSSYQISLREKLLQCIDGPSR